MKVDIESAADEVRGWVIGAVSDIAYEQGDETGALGDKLYDDVDTLCDLTGDRIHDAGRGDYLTMIAIAEEIKKSAHSSMVKALDSHIARWTKYSKKG